MPPLPFNQFLRKDEGTAETPEKNRNATSVEFHDRRRMDRVLCLSPKLATIAIAVKLPILKTAQNQRLDNKRSNKSKSIG